MTILGRVSDRAWGWIGPVGITLFAFVLRVWNLGYPNRFVFDETYYAKDAYSLLKHGYVLDFTDKANDKIVNGNVSGIFTKDPSWIVHPDGGRWLIALGESVFGFDSFGWRISGVLIGSLTVLVLARLVLRLTGSTLVACIAALLLTLDGMHFVMSRLALLDIFLTFWVVCGVACVVADRDWIRDRLDRRHLIRPWQLLAGLSFGMACATKWSGIYFLAAFGILTVIWEVMARRRADAPGPRRSWLVTVLRVGMPAFLSIVGVAALVYLASWTGFLVHHQLYEARFGRGYGEYSAPWGAYVDRPTSGFLGGTRDAFRSLWHFHVMTYDFHTKDLDNATHPYQSSPSGWLIQVRPVGADAVNNLPAASCGAAATSSCMRVITILGNPIIWWSGALALIASLSAWIGLREWRWSVPVVAVAVGWLPWYLNDDRPIFSFYAVSVVPFTIVAICLVIDALMRSGGSPRRRYVIALTIGLYVVAAAVTFWYFHPIYTDKLIPYDTWHHRMWFPRWI